MREVFAESYFLNHQEIYLTATVGISLFPEHGSDTETLMRKADLALKKAKTEGRPLRLFSQNYDDRGSDRIALETALRKATERDEIEVFYQPKVNLVSGRIVGVEALARWTHPSLGAIPPADFIPLAEEAGLIIPLGERVLRESLAQNRRWQNEGSSSVPVAVNISARQFMDEFFVQKVDDLLRASELDPRFLELEITESCLMHDPEMGIESVRALKQLGIRISIDDFGTGYSSLSYLKRFPVDALKIDRSFVKDMTESHDSASLVRAIINLGHIMGLRVIAEGVETNAQLEFLRAYNCDEIQGYLFSRAVRAEELDSRWNQLLTA